MGCQVSDHKFDQKNFLPQFHSFWFTTYEIGLAYGNISGKDKLHTAVTYAEEGREIGLVGSTRNFDISVMFYYKWKYI